jgi:DNA-binding NarL/FixJ family response regulator
MARAPRQSSVHLRRDAMPKSLRGAHFRIGEDEMAVLSFPLPSVVFPENLTKAEQEVAAAVISGKTNAEIASARRTSTRTVANQVASLFSKLGARSRNQIAAAVIGAKGAGRTRTRGSRTRI